MTSWTVTLDSVGRINVVHGSEAHLWPADDFGYCLDDATVAMGIPGSRTHLEWDQCTSTSHTPGDQSDFVAKFNAIIAVSSVTGVAAEPFVHAVLKGELIGVGGTSKFGRNPNISTSANETIWAVGGRYTWATAAETVRVASGGNANDTSAGSGARSVTIEGLDGDFNEVSETVATAGASASAATTQTFLRVNRAYVASAGTYHGFNTGDIIIEGVTSGNDYAGILTGKGQSQLGFYTVPAGKTAVMSDFSVGVNRSGGAATNVEVDFVQTQNADDVTTPFSGSRLFLSKGSSLGGSTAGSNDTAFTFPEKTDIEAICTFCSANATAVAVRWQITLYDN